MKGLRTHENDDFLKFFAIVEEHAQKFGKVFFMDSGEGDATHVGEYECETLSGWLIDSGDIAEFQKLYNGFSDIPDRFDTCYTFAEWKFDNSQIVIDFKKYA